MHVSKLNSNSIEPYRLFFPLGVAYAFAGVSVWLFYLAGWIPYPGAYHSNWMIGGFLLSFACGFLMTAVPKFTGAGACTNLELGLGVLLVLGNLISPLFMAALLFFLIFYFARRFIERTYAPPPHFIFVGLGLLLGLVGSIGIALELDPLLAFRVLFFQGIMVSFIIGIGARLVRVLLGYAPSPLVQIKNSIRAGDRGFSSWFAAESKKSITVNFLLLALGFVFEFFPALREVGRFLRAAALGWIAFSAWKLHRFPKDRGVLSWGLWVSCWLLFFGAIANPFAGGYAMHILHLVYIGGFGVMALLVASRVILSHGGFDIELERRSKLLACTVALGALAAVTRMSAPFLGAGYERHLGYAAFCWTLAISLWGAWMILKLWKKDANSILATRV